MEFGRNETLFENENANNWMLALCLNVSRYIHINNMYANSSETHFTFILFTPFVFHSLVVWKMNFRHVFAFYHLAGFFPFAFAENSLRLMWTMNAHCVQALYAHRAQPSRLCRAGVRVRSRNRNEIYSKKISFIFGKYSEFRVCSLQNTILFA